MTKKNKIIIFGAYSCPFTEKAIEFFESMNLKFEFCDVVNDMLCREEMIELTSQLTTPVIKINDNIIIGFDSKEIKKYVLNDN